MAWCCGGDAVEETHRKVGFQGPTNDMGDRTNWIKVAKYWTYIDLFVVFTFFDFFIQVRLHEKCCLATFRDREYRCQD